MVSRSQGFCLALLRVTQHISQTISNYLWDKNPETNEMCTQGQKLRNFSSVHEFGKWRT